MGRQGEPIREAELGARADELSASTGADAAGGHENSAPLEPEARTKYAIQWQFKSFVIDADDSSGGHPSYERMRWRTPRAQR